MLRSLAVFFGLLLMLGSGIAIAAWPRAHDSEHAQFLALQMKASYARVRAGITPVSQLAELGFATANARKLSYLGAMEQFMPSDSFGFDALDPAVQSCFDAQDRCTAFIFSVPDAPKARVVLLIEGGRVAYKAISGFEGLAANRARPQLRASLD